LSELADYRKIHGHCNVPRNNSENAKLANGSQQRQLQVAPRRKEIVYDALHPGIGKQGLNGTVTAPPGKNV
jgi:hypothetical protein